jgi:short-subunit dehydrogenase
MTNLAPLDLPAVDPLHLLIVGAGPGLAAAIARRFVQGGYHATLLARSTDPLEALAKSLANSGAVVDTVTGDASDPDGLRAIVTELYARGGAPGLVVYHASLFAPDSLTDVDVAAMHHAYDVNVVSGVVTAQTAAPWMQRGGGGTILFTGGGFADHPVPTLATLSLGKAALRSAASMLGSDLAKDEIRVACVTIAGQIVPGTAFDPDRIAEKYWAIVHSDGDWQSEYRYEGA